MTTETTPPAPPPDGAKPLSTLLAPRRLWWGRIGPDERLWLTVAFVWCLVMFTAMVAWQAVGEQRIPVESYRISEDAFRAEVEGFISARQVGDEGGVPVVEPMPGEDAYLQASMFQFQPVLQLQRGQTYRLLVSSIDVQHGLSLHKLGTSYNFQVLPGYLYVIRITPEDTGEFPIVCNEFCGLGHHVMTGRIIVVD
jgi:cytochrome c oxidase subunit II